MSELSKCEIISIIRTSKKYNNANFIFDEYPNGVTYITYILGDNKYKISVDDNWRRFNFKYSAYGYNMKSINVSLPKKNITSKKVLSKFREVVRNLIKMDNFIKIKEESFIKITPVIENFIRKEYSLGIISIIPNIYFPSTTYYARRRSRSSNFDVSKEKPENLKFLVSVSLNNGKVDYNLNFVYFPATKKLILEKKQETFLNFSKDVTKIIRSEKLKKLRINEEAAI